MQKPQPILEVENLHVDFMQEDDIVHAVKGVSFQLMQGECLAIVGESGSGKSVSAMSLLQLHDPSITRFLGTAEFSLNAEKINLIDAEEEQIQEVSGKEIALVFQEPMSAFNPTVVIGQQIGECMKIHNTLPRAAIKTKVLDLLREVELKDIKSVYSKYPHQLSGGQLQRCMIAMALANDPLILIADEPTTALDPAVQKSIIALLRNLQKRHNMSMLFVSHDLEAVKDIADRIMVMKDGYEKETNTTQNIFQAPTSAYAKALINCRPDASKKGMRLPTVADYLEHESVHLTPITLPLNEDVPALEVTDIHLTYTQKSWLAKNKSTQVLNGINFTIKQGEAVGLIGPSGCGKTSLGKIVSGWIKPTSGVVKLNENMLLDANQASDKAWHKKVQLIFQDPYSSLNPSMPIGDAITEPMLVHGIASGKKARAMAESLLEKVGLKKEYFSRFPHEFSGGQRQRIVIARALAVQPDVIVCDESVAALDVSVQAQVLNLLNDLRVEFNLSYLFISHDHNVVNYFCDRVLQMENGKILGSENATAKAKPEKKAKPATKARSKAPEEIDITSFRVPTGEENVVEVIEEAPKPSGIIGKPKTVEASKPDTQEADKTKPIQIPKKEDIEKAKQSQPKQSKPAVTEKTKVDRPFVIKTSVAEQKAQEEKRKEEEQLAAKKRLERALAEAKEKAEKEAEAQKKEKEARLKKQQEEQERQAKEKAELEKQRLIQEQKEKEAAEKRKETERLLSIEKQRIAAEAKAKREAELIALEAELLAKKKKKEEEKALLEKAKEAAKIQAQRQNSLLNRVSSKVSEAKDVIEKQSEPTSKKPAEPKKPTTNFKSFSQFLQSKK